MIGLKSAALAASAAAVLASPTLEPYQERGIENMKLPEGRPEIPMRLSCEKDSPFYNPQIASRLGIEFEGAKRRNDVREYCIEDAETGRGWVRLEVRLPNGKPRIERGRYITVTKRGIIKPYWQ